MLGIMKDDAEVGYYGSAVKIKTILLTIVTSIGTVLLPRVSYDYQNGEMEEFWRLIKKSVNFILVISLPMTLFFVLFSKPSILLLSGQDYLPAVIPMGIITPTIIIVGLSNITGIQLLLPFGKEKIVLYSEITGAVVDFTINLILIPKMGVVGAAIGTLVAEIVVLLFQCVYLRKDLKHIFVNSSYLKILIGLLISTISIIWVFNLNLSSILTLLIGASIFFAVYFIIMLLEKEAIVVEMVSTFFLTIKKKNGAKQ